VVGESRAMLANMNPSNSAGAVMNHNLQQIMIQQHSPWLSRPTNDDELVPPEERFWIYQDEDLYFEDAQSTQGMLKDPDGNTYITGPSLLQK